MRAYEFLNFFKFHHTRAHVARLATAPSLTRRCRIRAAGWGFIAANSVALDAT
jgi:hypothetical protein